jgi:hypothetical protein
MEQFKESREVSEKEIQQIIFLSYMFSQGSITLQASLIQAIAKIIGHQDENETRKVFNRFAESLKFEHDNGNHSFTCTYTL